MEGAGQSTRQVDADLGDFNTAAFDLHKRGRVLVVGDDGRR